MQSGEITAIGLGDVIIPLHKVPARVEVRFKDDLIIIPCNPQHLDELEYDVHVSHHHHGGFILKIKWEVSGLREIVWNVFY
jgi:hypothetical protein